MWWHLSCDDNGSYHNSCTFPTSRAGTPLNAITAENFGKFPPFPFHQKLPPPISSKTPTHFISSCDTQCVAHRHGKVTIDSDTLVIGWTKKVGGHMWWGNGNVESKKTCQNIVLQKILSGRVLFVSNIFCCENILGKSSNMKSTSAAKNFLLYWAINKVWCDCSDIGNSFK